MAIKFGSITIPRAEVIKVHFTDRKVQYDLEIPISTDKQLKMRIYNVDSLLVEEV